MKKELTESEIEEILESEAMERYYEAKDMQAEATFDDDLEYKEAKEE